MVCKVSRCFCSRFGRDAYKEAANCVDTHKHHDTNDEAPVELCVCDAQQRRTDGKLDDTDSDEEDGLTDKVHLHAFGQSLLRNIAKVLAGAVGKGRDDDSLACDDEAHGDAHEVVLSADKVSQGP